MNPGPRRHGTDAWRVGGRGARKVAAGLAAVVAGAWLPATSPVAQAATAPLTATLAWHSCDKTYKCASLSVPLEYSDPKGTQIKIAVAELPSTNKHPMGDLVMNPGGPGASGEQFIEGGGFPASLTSEFNLISFDPRGVGASDPVNCVNSAGLRALVALTPDPTTPSQVSGVVKATKTFDEACAQHTPKELLENVSTLNTARDMDRLRAALGQSQLNYMGFSYGTYLGEVYAEHFPGRLRTLVLDGVVDPTESVDAVAAGQAAGFDMDLNDFFAWCPTNKTCKSELPKGAKQSYEELIGSLNSGTVVYGYLQPKYGGTQQVTTGVVVTAAIGSLYTNQTWSYLAEGISSALNGNGGYLLALAYSYEGLMANGQFSNLSAASEAISCLDRSSPTSVSSYEELAASLAKKDPYFGAASAWSNLGCAYWPVKAQGHPSAFHPKDAPPVLLIGSTGDPATPYQNTESVARQLGTGGRLLTRDGPGHTGYLYSTCIQKWTNRYLETRQLPPKGETCPTNS